jgi:hypothetical protein
VSKAKDDLPEPDNPVITINLFRGSATSMPFKLCIRAPLIIIKFLGLSLVISFSVINLFLSRV